jgi:peptidoglycan/LPS O-acetylase OafA/YrhL
LQKLTSIQAIRGFAAFAVLLYHTEALYTIYGLHAAYLHAFTGLSMGVDLFFVLSGFIMVYVHRGDMGVPRRYRPYLQARLVRIYPLLWIVSLLAIASYAAHVGGGRGDKLHPTQLICSLMLLPQSSPPLVNVSWTLVYEIFFYVLFGVVILSRAFGLALLVAWQLAVLATYCLGLDTAPTAMLYLRPIALEFGFGMVVGGLITSKPRWLDAAAVSWGCFACGVLLLGLFLARPEIGPRFATFGPASALIVYGVAALERAGRLKSPRWLVHLGDASYALYLINFSVLTLVASLFVRLHLQRFAPVLAPVLTLAGLAAGEILHMLVEKPLGRVLRRVLPGGRHERSAHAVVEPEISSTQAAPQSPAPGPGRKQLA